ncbi:MAG: exo-alpha-sialidase [Clostridia bacterium]|nr:exo-alpha-sialidase [Clostridia bacterium]
MNSKIIYEQIFDNKEFQSERNRIPALYTLNDGSVMAGADIRYAHGSDSPNNIDIAVAISKDGYTDWNYVMVNHFDDYADTVTSTDSASFIDSAIVQSSSGRIFMLVDAQPSECGYLQAKTGTGYCEINGKKHLLLTKDNNGDKLNTFAFYVGDFDGDFAPIFTKNDNKITEYSISREFCLYKNGEPLYTEQKGSEGVKIQQNIFYSASELKCYKTTYLWVKYSDDNGKTWSTPQIISESVKNEKESFLGVGPGRGMKINHNGKERILFCVYDNNGLFKDPIFENASVVYTDDNGATWHRSNKIKIKKGIGKTSEAQLVKIEGKNYKALRIYARNLSNYIAYADSLDGGVTWTEFRADKALEGTKNCMVSLMETSKKIDNKQVILCSAGGNLKSRADGLLRVGVTEDNGQIHWISKYHLTQGFYGYSCLTELFDGNFAVFYEDEAAHLKYTIFSVSDDGIINEINNKNLEFKEDTSSKIQRSLKAKRTIANIKFKLGLM